MSTHPSVSVVIVSWNVADSLSRCISSVLATHYPNLEIIVVDNASADESVKALEKFMDENITLRRNTYNLGFPIAVNQGLNMSSGDYLLLLNPDTRLPKSFFAQGLEFFASHPDAMAMGPKLEDPDGTPQGSVFPEPSISSYIQEFWLGKTGITSKYVPAGNHPLSVNAISGACMLFPRSTFQQVGQLTEKVFMYYEDLDYCRRIRQVGGKVYFNPQISVVHEHGQSAGKSGGKTNKYIQDASRWYNGFFKYHLINFIIKSGRLIRG